MVEVGLKYDSEVIVSDSLLAANIGSGDMPVLATPMMAALMENAAMFAIKDYLSDGQTSVGIYIETSHIKPSKKGDSIHTVARVTNVDGNKIDFHVAAYSGGDLIGEGKHIRYIVDRKKFMNKLIC